MALLVYILQWIMRSSLVDLRAELTRDHLRLDLDSHSGRLEEPTARHSGARDRQRQMHADILRSVQPRVRNDGRLLSILVDYIDPGQGMWKSCHWLGVRCFRRVRSLSQMMMIKIPSFIVNWRKLVGWYLINSSISIILKRNGLVKILRVRPLMFSEHGRGDLNPPVSLTLNLQFSVIEYYVEFIQMCSGWTGKRNVADMVE